MFRQPSLPFVPAFIHALPPCSRTADQKARRACRGRRGGWHRLPLQAGPRHLPKLHIESHQQRRQGEHLLPGRAQDGAVERHRATTRLREQLVPDGFCFVQVDVLVTTAGGIEEDLIKCLGPVFVGDFTMSGKDLYKKGLNR